MADHTTSPGTAGRRRAAARRPSTGVGALAALTLVLTAACGCVAGAATDDVVLRVGPLNTQNTLTLAIRDGRVGEAVPAGVSVTDAATFPAFAPAAEAMAAGQVDMTSGSVTSLVAALAGNPDLVVFAVEACDGDTQGIVAAPGTGIAEVADLAGHTVAINEGGTGDYLLRLALDGAGLSVDDVTPVPLSPPEAAAAFATGQVDAWATWDQYLAAAELTPGARLVATAAQIGATNPTVHVVDRAFLDAHPQVVAGVYQALVAQADAVVAEPGLLERAYLDAGATDDVAAAVTAKRPPTIGPADAQVAADIAAVAQFYAEQGLTPAVVETGGATVDVQELAD